MQGFEHVNAASVEEAVSVLRQYAGAAMPISGGTDLISGLRAGIYPDAPAALVNLKTIPELQHIREADGTIRIGAAVTLTDLVESELIQDKLPLLAAASAKTASQLLRNSGTIGGNICQENRCWYYRYPDQLGNRMDCARKGGKKCFAVGGDSRYHSIFGAVKRCIAVNPSDTAPALIAMDARVATSKKTLPIGDFFSAKNGCHSTVLAEDEILSEIIVPIPPALSRSCFLKFAIRKSIDFPIVNCAVRLDMDGDVVSGAAVSLNAVYCNPVRAVASEQFLVGKIISEAVAEQAAKLSVAEAKPLPKNKYKVQIAKTLVKDALMNSR